MDAIKQTHESATRRRSDDKAPFPADQRKAGDPAADGEVRRGDTPGWKNYLALLKRLGLPLADREALLGAYNLAVRDLERQLSKEEGSPHRYEGQDWEDSLLRRFLLRRAATEVWRAAIDQACDLATDTVRERVVGHITFETRQRGNPSDRKRDLIDPWYWDLAPLDNESECEQFLHLQRLVGLIAYQDEARAIAGIKQGEAARAALGIPERRSRARGGSFLRRGSR